MQVQVGVRRQEEAPSRRFIKLESKGVKQQKFEFKTQELAFSVREVVYQKIIAFDANGDQRFDEHEIRDFLVTVLHEAETEIHYFIKNVFRYDYNNDGVIEYDELVNFCMEQHLGEIAIQRLHRQKLYSRGSQRQMNGEEFAKTIGYALSFLQFKTNPAHLDSLFRSVDLDADGFISYEDYFRFLKEYFGSKSLAAGLVNTTTVIEEMKHPELKELDVVKKYSKYEKGNDGGAGQIPQKPLPSNSGKNNIIAGTGKGSEAGNQNQNTNQSALNSSGLSNLDAKTDNNSAGKDPEGNSSDKKKHQSNPQGIEVTIGKPAVKPKTEEVAMSEQEAAVASKIARLVLTQVKTFLINFDTGKTLRLSFDEIIKSFRTGLNFNETNVALLLKRANISKDKKYTYEEAAKLVATEFAGKVFSEVADWSKTVAVEDFVGLFDRVCSLVPNTPLIERFEQLYKLRVTRNGPFDYNEFHAVVCAVFNQFAFRR